MIYPSWMHKHYVCKECKYEIVVTQPTEEACDYWYYCSNKTCKNHDPGEQLGDMEECSFFHIKPAAEAPIEDEEWVGFPPPKSVTEALLRYPDWPWEVLSMDDLTDHDYRIVRVAPTVDRTMIIWIKDRTTSDAAPEPTFSGAMIRLHEAVQEKNVPVPVFSWDLATILDALVERMPHPDDAPGGPYHAIPADQTKLGVTTGDKRWLVHGTDGTGCIYGTEGECKDIRDVLNRHALEPGGRIASN